MLQPSRDTRIHNPRPLTIGTFSPQRRHPCRPFLGPNQYHTFHQSDPDMKTRRTISLSLPADLMAKIEEVAEHQGKSIDETVAGMLNQAVTQFTTRGIGRCSLRTGLQSEGPRPLPLQQP